MTRLKFWITFITLVICSVDNNDSYTLDKKSLKIPKGQWESVYRRRTDNAMAKRKVQKDKQRSTKHTYQTKDRVTRIPLKTGGELRCSGRVSSSCSTNGTRRVNSLLLKLLRDKRTYHDTITRQHL